jgi:hypothetical protein
MALKSVEIIFSKLTRLSPENSKIQHEEHNSCSAKYHLTFQCLNYTIHNIQYSIIVMYMASQSICKEQSKSHTITCASECNLVVCRC